MIQRCTNPKSAKWSNYGGRGIKVCRRWCGPNGFVQFIIDMGEPPSNEHSIERKNNDGNYTPNNCVWALRTKQMRNRRNNRELAYNGKTKLLIEWAEEFNIPYKELHRRIVSRGWDTEAALTTPVHALELQSGRRGKRGKNQFSK